MTTFGEKHSRKVRTAWHDQMWIQNCAIGTVIWGILFTVLHYMAIPLEIGARIMFTHAAEYKGATIALSALLVAPIFPAAFASMKLVRNALPSLQNRAEDVFSVEEGDYLQNNYKPVKSDSGGFYLENEQGGIRRTDEIEKRILEGLADHEWMSKTYIKSSILQCNYEKESGPAIKRLIDAGLMITKPNDRPGPGRKGDLFKLTESGYATADALTMHDDN